MRTFRASLKHHFIPHAGNNYHPHIFHTKRAVFYSAFFVAIKAFLVGYAVLLPIQAYTAPDVLSAQAERILALTNETRKTVGFPALARASVLDRTAGARSSDMAESGYFGHVGPNGHTFAYFMKPTGDRYVNAGENLAEGFSTAEDVVSAWTNSPSHYANLVEGDFEEFGIGISEGVYEGTPTIFITEHFGEPGRENAADQKDAPQTAVKPGMKTKTSGSGTLAAVPAPEAASTVPGRQATSSATAATGTVLGISTDRIEPALASLSHAGTTKSAPLDRYIFAKSWFSGVFSVFSVSRWIYFAFLVFFAVALGFSLAIEFRKHHPHAAAKAAGLIGLLFVLWKF